MKNVLGWLFALVIGVSAASFAAAEKTNKKEEKKPPLISIQRVEGNRVYFEGPESASVPKSLEISHPHFEPVGLLRPRSGHPFLLLSASPCKNCEKQKFLQLIKTTGESKLTFVYPGKIRSSRGRILMDSRAFYGNCLPDRSDVYVVFQKERVDRRRYLQRSVFIAEVTETGVKESLIARRRPQIKDTLRRVKQKKCTEIKGFNRQTS